jgi:hypothetical protein
MTLVVNYVNIILKNLIEKDYLYEDIISHIKVFENQSTSLFESLEKGNIEIESEDKQIK